MRLANVICLPTVLAHCVLILSSTTVDAQLATLEQTDSAPTISREEAIKAAVKYTGLGVKQRGDAKITARYGLATDPSVAFSDLVKRPVWEVLFEDIDFSDLANGGGGTRGIILDVHAVIDADSGKLLRIASPAPKEGGLKDLTRDPETWLRVAQKRTMEPGCEAQPVAFAAAVASRVEPEWRVTEVVAYLGYETGGYAHRRLSHRPCWLIWLAGRLGRPPSGGPPPGEDATITERMVTVDAATGEYVGGRFYGKPSNQTDPGDSK